MNRLSRRFPARCILALCLVSFSAMAMDMLSGQESQLKTVAEHTNYTDTATGEEVGIFLRSLATEWETAELTSIGTSTEGRPLWALVIDPAGTGAEPIQVDASAVIPPGPKPLTVLLLGGIHSGECDGKEALLALARDMAGGQAGDWWQGLRIIFVPNINADGNARRGLAHRPGQAGPSEGMGIRENAQHLDLNRDFIKLDSPEIRSLVAAINKYDVDVLIDMHTTNGSLHQYQLTYDIPHHPALPESINELLREDIMPSVQTAMREDGYETFWYGNYDREHRRWMTYGYEPRYSTEYMGLRGRIGILSESYSYVSYETRVKASYAFVVNVLKQLVEKEEEVSNAIFKERTAPKALVRAVPTAAEIVQTSPSVETLGFETEDGQLPRPPYNAASLTEHRKKDYTVQLWNSVRTTDSMPLPVAYAIPAQHAWAVSRLMRHGIKVKQLQAPVKTDVQASRLTKVEQARSFQRHDMLSIETDVEGHEVTLNPGCFIVEMNQPLAMLAATMLEPSAPDSLASWNFFDPEVAEGELFPVVRLITESNLNAISSAVDVPHPPKTEQLSLPGLFAPGKSVRYGGASQRAPRWLKGSSEYVIQSGSRSYAVDADSGSRRRLSELDVLRQKLESLEAFDSQQAQQAASIDVFTDDWAFALVRHNSDLYYFAAESETVRQLTHSPEATEQLAELSPIGKHVAFVRDNNLWVVDCESTELKALTDDGEEGKTLNGILDWVYQEELYGRGNFKGFWWNPTGTHIAYLRLDESPVPTYQVGDSTSYAQTLEPTRYPKAGQPLPTVEVWMVDVATGERSVVDLSAMKGAGDEPLVARVSWSPQGELWLQVFNRVQNYQCLVKVDPAENNAVAFLEEESPGWIEVRGTPRFLPEDKGFLWLSDLPDGRTHLHRVAPNGSKTQLTRGEWDVSQLVGVSDDGKYAFVTGNISSPIEEQLIGVDLESGEVRQITSAPGTHRVQVNAAGSHFIDQFSNIESQPFVSLHRIDGELLRVLEAPISDRHDFLQIGEPETFTIKARDGLELQAQLMLPPGFEPEKAEQPLPVVIYVYGGPQAPTIRNAWAGRNYWWHQLLCQKGFAVLLCDNRASRGRGVQDTWTIRGDMCRVELQDLEDAVAWLGTQKWADMDRVGLWGWSYGGYFTSYAMTHCELFQCGIAGAPVTDWRNYDAIYTERYMDLPQQNEAGYDSSSVVKAAGNLSGRLLIIHGEKDDNVHMSNTLQLTNALQEAGKQFELMIYPKNRHGIVDPQQRYHLYELMTEFFVRNLAR